LLQGRFEAALRKLNEAIENRPTTANLYASRAIAQLELGNIDAAVEDCKMCISVNPHDDAAYLRLASMHSTVGQNYKAIQTVGRGLER